MNEGCTLGRIPERIDLTRIRPEKNERRFYAIEIKLDLFSAISLVRSWGRIGTAGRERLDHHSDIATATSAGARLAARKQKRGYQPR